jgi:RNA polymerase sigma-70 factor, ECF subfamily
MDNNITDIFKKTYEEQSDSIFRFCLTRVSNREQALDLTQETFLRFWKTLLDGENVKNGRAYLFTVAHHLIIDWYRKKKSISLEGMSDFEDEPYDVLDEKTTDSMGLGAEGRFVLKKINELAPKYKESVYLRFIENLTPQEIGKILNISANAAGVRINRGVEELRKKTGYNDLNK